MRRGAIEAGIYGLPAGLGAAAVCVVVRMLGVRFGLQARGPLGAGRDDDR